MPTHAHHYPGYSRLLQRGHTPIRWIAPGSIKVRNSTGRAAPRPASRPSDVHVFPILGLRKRGVPCPSRQSQGVVLRRRLCLISCLLAPFTPLHFLSHPSSTLSRVRARRRGMSHWLIDVQSSAPASRLVVRPRASSVLWAASSLCRR